LQADGKIALYGLFFDTGKAEVKAESKPQLDEMAKLLQGQPALKVYIVGHTDSQGGLEANLALSQQRAQAVVAALAGAYKVDAKRLQARGVASLAPVASNANDAGRARNRRVELVIQ
jgi:OmpA-OmpF porin, OOP family